MDDLIQVLIFIVTFIIFIVSAVRKQKKKPTTGSSGFDEAFESLFGLPTVTENPIPATEPPPVKKSEPRILKKEQKQPVLFEEGIDAIPNKTTRNENEVDKNQVLGEFDLRQAVIYQTILSRKEF